MEAALWLIAQQLLTSGAADALAEVALKAVLPAISAALLWYARKLPGAIRQLEEMREEKRISDARINALESAMRARCDQIERSAADSLALAKDSIVREIRDTNHALANVRTVVAVLEERQHHSPRAEG